MAASLALTRMLASLLYEITARDPVTFSVVGVLVMGIAVLASYLPVRRAATVDPVMALRVE
ncbi:MAG TPA: hypothetical protein VMW38_19785 [Terriglobia bacterium]|nr:hypothetical protein [Terriglobia bacterium]